jgi:hypothetical protein
MKINFDVDIDMADRDQILSLVEHTPASIFREGLYTKHNSGVYFQNIPKLPMERISAIDYKLAEEQGWFKVDFLNNRIYQDVRDEQHLLTLMNAEPMWELLEHSEVVSDLYHINQYHSLLVQYKPRSVEQLAMILAMIRPAKRHLIGETWDEIQKTVWEPTVDSGYHFKKSHAHAFAVAIVVQLNLICEKLLGVLD